MQILKNSNAALPEEAAEFLERFATEFNLDPDAGHPDFGKVTFLPIKH